MRILLISRKHYIEGGADRVYINTGQILQENNYKVGYFSTKHNKNIDTEYKPYFIDDHSVYNISGLKKVLKVKQYLYNRSAAKSLAKLIQDFKPDLAHLHLFYGYLSGSILTTLKQYGVPIIVTIHDYRLLCPASAMLDRHGNICEKCKTHKYHNCLLNRCSAGSVSQSGIIMIEALLRQFRIDPLKLVDHFIFVSKFSRNKHIEFEKRYINKSSHLYNFTPTHEHKMITKGDYILYYGRLSKEKGIITLINAVNISNTKLIIAGSGPQEKAIISYINNFTNIEFIGFKTGEELNTVIMNASFIAVPSEWYENNPMTIVESFALGKPVIGSEIGGIPELVNNSTGVLFESGNIESLSSAINKSINISNEEYIKLSNNCFEFASNYFSKVQHLENLRKIYQKVCYEYTKGN